MAIRNVVFDFGNVIVRWDPPGIVAHAFGAEFPPERSGTALFSQCETWHALNRGELTMDVAKKIYRTDFALSEVEADRLFIAIFDNLIPVAGTISLMRRLKDAGYGLYGLTDNVREVIEHLKQRNDFWGMFDGVTVSAEYGMLKPDPQIFHRLLDDYDLVAEECVFFDDIPANIEGASLAKMSGRVFTDAASAENDLRAMGLTFDRA